MKVLEEALLEPVVRYLRFHEIIRHLPKKIAISVVDIGAGPQIRFYQYAKKKNITFSSYTAFDPLLNIAKLSQRFSDPKITYVKKNITKKISLPDSCTDYVIALAYLEHIDFPYEIMAEMFRILKPGGKIILTTPTPKAQKILEFLAFKLHVISKREIAEHKQYFTKESLLSLLGTLPVSTVHHSYFEYGCNNLLVITK